jgi:transposase-like protein
VVSGGWRDAVRHAGPGVGRYLSFAEREEIALLRARGAGVREIARQLGRSPSTISRELRRNAATRGGGLEYRATTAQWHADKRARRPKPAKLAVNPELRRYVQDRLSGAVKRPDGITVDGPQVKWVGRRHGRRHRRWARSWSPEQISNRLHLDFADDQSQARRAGAACTASTTAARWSARTLTTTDSNTASCSREAG